MNEAKVSDDDTLRAMYGETATAYSEMMDTEIELPIYGRTLGVFIEAMKNVPGAILDSSCGTGHLLERLYEKHDSSRELLGQDLSSEMVGLAAKRLGDRARVAQGDMRTLTAHGDASLAGLVSFFALHHLDPNGVVSTLCEWRRVLRPGGALLLGTWEGKGNIDYGDAADVAALFHDKGWLKNSLVEAGFAVDFAEERFEKEMEMNSIYLCAKAT